jgi:hypothetical protein
MSLLCKILLRHYPMASQTLDREIISSLISLLYGKVRKLRHLPTDPKSHSLSYLSHWATETLRLIQSFHSLQEIESVLFTRWESN